MTTLTEENTWARTKAIVLSYKVVLDDLQQILVDTFNYSYQWNNGTTTLTKQEPIKLVLKELNYSYDNETNQFELNGITCVGFRKDNKIRARQSYLWKSRSFDQQFNDVAQQIPDHFHDRARVAFQEMTQQLQDELTQLTMNGVKVA